LTEELRKLGGSGNVVLNAASLEAKVRVVGRIGSDSEGEFFRKTLCDLGVDDKYLYDDGHTIVKTRIAAKNQQFIRIDDEVITIPSETIRSKIESQIECILKDITVVIISDYAKGFISEEIAQLFIRGAKGHGIPILVDPKGKSPEKYRGATALTPNNKEFLDMTELTAIPDEEVIKDEALRLCGNNDYEYLIFTRSEKGISIIDHKNSTKSDYPAIAKEVVDVTGAGDTVVTALALSLGAGFNLDKCAEVANHAASIVISKFGAAQTTIGELSLALCKNDPAAPDLKTLLQYLEVNRRQGKRIVFTNGCFDLIHAGHISSFKQAREFGDLLVVGVNSDKSIRRIKGESRPIIDLQNRIDLLSSIRYIDCIISFDEDTPQALIEQLKPDVLVKGKEWQGKEVAGSDFVKSYGGRMEFIELEQGLSTSVIIERIMNKKGVESTE
jgi:D-beta-D-heptose 7-phosphate kinase/D-beta-D-heptose 1-phosphate adenosyltransferase